MELFTYVDNYVDNFLLVFLDNFWMLGYNIKQLKTPTRGVFLKESNMGKKSKGARQKITLECTVCKQRNYDTEKNKKNDNERIVLNKYCRFCKGTKEHKETK